MSKQLTSYRVFIASPSGLEEERQVFRDTLNEYNEEAVRRGVHFRPVGWEETLGGVGRPQSIINKDIVSCDYFFTLLWNRWGSSPEAPGEEGFSSGVEEEYNLALECVDNADLPMLQVVVFFKAPTDEQIADPGPELAKVLEFKRGLEQSKQVLYRVYDTTYEFKTFLRRHLADWVYDHEDSHSSSGLADDPGGTGPS